VICYKRLTDILLKFDEMQDFRIADQNFVKMYDISEWRMITGGAEE
jgi:hypothetical protein